MAVYVFVVRCFLPFASHHPSYKLGTRERDLGSVLVKMGKSHGQATNNPILLSYADFEQYTIEQWSHHLVVLRQILKNLGWSL